MLPAETQIVRRTTDGADEHEAGHPDVRTVYNAKYAERGMSKEYARLAWRRYLGHEDDFFAIPSLAVQDELTKSTQEEAAAVCERAAAFEEAVEMMRMSEDNGDWELEAGVGLDGVKRDRR